MAIRRVTDRTIMRAVEMFAWMDGYARANGCAPTIRQSAAWYQAAYDGSDSSSVAKWYWDLMGRWGWIATLPRLPRTLRLLKTVDEVLADAASMGVTVELPDGAPRELSEVDLLLTCVRHLDSQGICDEDARRVADALATSSLRWALVEALETVIDRHRMGEAALAAMREYREDDAS